MMTTEESAELDEVSPTHPLIYINIQRLKQVLSTFVDVPAYLETALHITLFTGLTVAAANTGRRFTIP
jgi:hypothetical protein